MQHEKVVAIVMLLITCLSFLSPAVAQPKFHSEAQKIIEEKERQEREALEKAQQKLIRKEVSYPVVVSVFGHQRSKVNDILFFTNGDVMRGQILNESVTIATQYGLIVVPFQFCTGISFINAHDSREVIITSNFNRYSGIITDRMIRFQIGTTGPEITVSKEELNYIVTHTADEEVELFNYNHHADLFIMTNSDLVSGEIADRKLAVRTASGETGLDITEIREIQFENKDGITTFLPKDSDEFIKGSLVTDTFDLEILNGVQVPAVYKSHFERVIVDRAIAEILNHHAGTKTETEQIVSKTQDGRFFSNTIGMRFAMIPAGQFTMGSPTNEFGRDNDEIPHRVTISRPFYMGITEVTQDQWDAVMDKNPSRYRSGSRPVDTVSWHEAVEFCKRLSEREGRKYFLPTEAQWEYACRAGSNTPFNTGDELEQANYDTSDKQGRGYRGGSWGKTIPVGSFQPNDWGLYDMHGNVWEWCADWYGDYTTAAETDPTGSDHGSECILRGGAWNSTSHNCRSANRNSLPPDNLYPIIGFRVALDMHQKMQVTEHPE